MHMHALIHTFLSSTELTLPQVIPLQETSYTYILRNSSDRAIYKPENPKHVDIYKKNLSEQLYHIGGML